MAKNELLPFADGEDANVLPTNQWEALTDILENGFQSGIARSEQVNRVLAQGAVASYVLGQLIVDELNQDATLDKDTLYQRLVSALKENAKDACLPLSGGTMSGAIKTSIGDLIVKTTDDGYLCITGATKSTNGARIVLSGKDRQGLEGRFTIVARDATNESSLTGLPDGTLQWQGKNIITSAGGTMTGTITTSVTRALAQSGTSGCTGVYGGTHWNTGGYIALYGKDSSGNEGNVALEAHNGTQSTKLILKPEGTLTWGGKKVVCVESWRSGNKWYRKYADGFIEQGGYFSGASNGNHIVTLNTAFTTTDYTVLVLNKGQISHDAFNGFGENGKTTTTMTIYSWTGARTGFYWEAKGY